MCLCITPDQSDIQQEFFPFLSGSTVLSVLDEYLDRKYYKDVCITLIHLSHPSLVSPSSKYSSNGLGPIQWFFRMRQLSMCNQHIWRRKLPKRMMRQHHRVQTIIWVYRCYFLGVKVTKYPRSLTGRDTGMVNLFCERTLKMYLTQQCTRWPSLVDKQLR